MITSAYFIPCVHHFLSGVLRQSKPHSRYYSLRQPRNSTSQAVRSWPLGFRPLGILNQSAPQKTKNPDSHRACCLSHTHSYKAGDSFPGTEHEGETCFISVSGWTGWCWFSFFFKAATVPICNPLCRKQMQIRLEQARQSKKGQVTVAPSLSLGALVKQLLQPS